MSNEENLRLEHGELRSQYRQREPERQVSVRTTFLTRAMYLDKMTSKSHVCAHSPLEVELIPYFSFAFVTKDRHS